MGRLIDITIKKEDVYKDVEIVTEYFGSHNVDAAGNSLYDSVAITKYNAERLDKFWGEACCLIADPIKQFVVYLNDADGELTVGLNMPTNFVISFQEPIKRALYEFIKNSILSKWYGIAYKAEADIHAAAATANLIELREKLFARKAPVRVNHKS